MTTATISPKVAAQAESVSLQDIVTRNMKVAMTLRNVKQKDLANALGVDRSSISQKMTRRVAWSLEDIEKASDFFQKLMIRLGAECGLRRGEIARVHSDNVVADSAGRSLIVRGKGDKQRIVPLPDDLAGIIMDAHGYLFPGRFGGHVEESYVGDHISHLLPDGYGAHTLRHRFATVTYATTHDLFVVAELLGHESVETTEHYVAMPDGRLRAATAAVRLDV